MIIGAAGAKVVRCGPAMEMMRWGGRAWVLRSRLNQRIPIIARPFKPTRAFTLDTAIRRASSQTPSGPDFFFLRRTGILKFFRPAVLASESKKRWTASSALADTAPEPGPELAPYEPPTKGLLSHLPTAVVPYAELIRLDKPTGTYYLFFPCLFSTLLAAPLATPIVPPLSVAGYTALFFTGALVMRGAGCTINDLWDRNLDPHVARTRLRPIARGAISPFNALAFTGAQLLTGLAVLLQFPLQCLYYGVPSLALVATYPLAKRVTHYPQFVLGLTFSWGAIMGFPALGVDLLGNQAALTAAACLYAANVAWTVLYDMIYAHMDIKDDAKAGIKSIALRHDKDTKAVLSGLAVVQVALLAAAGSAAGAGPLFFAGSCGGAALTLGTMIWKVRLKSVADCWWWFRNGAWLTGGAIATGLVGDYLVKLSSRDEETETDGESRMNGKRASSPSSLDADS